MLFLLALLASRTVRHMVAFAIAGALVLYGIVNYWWLAIPTLVLVGLLWASHQSAPRR